MRKGVKIKLDLVSTQYMCVWSITMNTIKVYDEYVLIIYAYKQFKNNYF